MQTKLIRIGNSQGVRLPRAVIQAAGLTGDIELAVRAGVVTLRPLRAQRSGWADAAERCHENGDDGLVLGEPQNAFDEEW